MPQLHTRSASVALAVSLLFASPSRGHEDRNAHGDQTNDRSAAIMTTRGTSRVLPPPKGDDVFHFVVYGDRTGGVPEGLRVLEQAVVDTNLLDPDLVMTVGDLIQGYNEEPEWIEQMKEYKEVMSELKMPWYPVAGNHDVYWQGKGPAPQGHNESHYEKHFGPLWYWFRHKNAGFIVLYSDEGDPATNRKGFNQGALQRMSEAQLAFLDKALTNLQDADHVFAFLHHPRWIGGGYVGGNWDEVHRRLVEAGNVTAVFAGHIHHMRYDGPRDGIEYYTLATTGGNLESDIPGAGYLHHLNLVTVRKDRISVATLPIGAVIDPKEFTPEFLEQIALARSIRPEVKSEPLTLNVDGSAAGAVRYTISNPSPRAVDVTASFDQRGCQGRWLDTLDHQHFTLAAGESQEIEFSASRPAGDPAEQTLPAVRLQIDYLGEAARVRLPDVVQRLAVQPAAVPVDYFAGDEARCLQVDSEHAAVRVNGAAIELPDGPMTIEAWVRPSELAGYRAIVAKSQVSEYAIFSDEGAPRFDIFLDGSYVTAAATDKLSADKWTHLAGTFDGRQAKLFVDGKLVATKPASGRRRSNRLPLFIGADPDGQGQPTQAFTGQIDEVRLSRGAIYTAPFAPKRRLAPTDETVLLFHFDKNLGPFVLDHSRSATAGVLGPASKLAPAEQ